MLQNLPFYLKTHRPTKIRKRNVSKCFLKKKIKKNKVSQLFVAKLIISLIPTKDVSRNLFADAVILRHTALRL
jgi:hypothetical protein